VPMFINLMKNAHGGILAIYGPAFKVFFLPSIAPRLTLMRRSKSKLRCASTGAGAVP
jgi:hypothetical protein